MLDRKTPAIFMHVLRPVTWPVRSRGFFVARSLESALQPRTGSAVHGDFSFPHQNVQSHVPEQTKTYETASFLGDPSLGALEAELIAPYAYTCASKGKGVRVKFVHALNHWFQCPASAVAIVGNVTQVRTLEPLVPPHRAPPRAPLLIPLTSA